MSNWLALVFVFLGSGVGGSLRYLVTQAYNQSAGSQSKHYMPIFMVNVIGSFLIGILFSYLLKTGQNERISLFFITGLLGGFTTFSSFSLDVLRLLQNHQEWTAFGYIIATVLLGILFAGLGYKLGSVLG